MFISGKGVSRRGTENQLLTGTDLFATLAEIAGLSLNEYNDSKSFKSLLTQSLSNPVRNYQYSELNDNGIDLWTISNGNYKLHVNSLGNQEYYYLSSDPYEANNLLNTTLSPLEQNVKSDLENELARIRQ